mmetsp:Transcript_8746/g.36216  ORF Transcript_8746/g.36216 Transcript_8746/m.36216 type:complete len:846 (-) Transcript_8746:343-2880(-)
MPQTAPDPNVLLRERRDRREQILADRAGKGTARMYGDGTRGATGHFMRWCKAKPGETYLGVTMPADKEVYSGAAHHKTIELFLGQWVVKRPLLDKKGKPIPGTEGGLSKESVKAYVKALSDLQKGQKTQEEFMDEVRDAEKPCESREITSILTTHAIQTSARKKSQCVDKATGRVLCDGYDKQQHREFSSIGISNNAPTYKTCGITNHLISFAHVLRHAMAFRGDDASQVTWGDTFGYEAKGECADPKKECILLVMAHDKSKANLDGVMYYSAAMRHATDPFVCPHFHLALFMFTLQDASVEQRPTFRPIFDNTGKMTALNDTYESHVLPSVTRSTVDLRRPVTARTRSTHARWAQKNIAHPIDATKAAHLERGESLRHAERHGVSLHQISRHGYYKGSICQDHYLEKLSLESVRAHADFPIAGGHAFWLRDSVQPPEALTKKVFERLLKPYYDLKAEYERWGDESKVVDVATQGFVKLLEYLAKVLAQDLALMQPEMSSHACYSVMPFNDDSYGFKTFQKRLLDEMKNDGVEQLQATASEAQQRGDEKCANFARDVLSSVMSLLQRNGVVGGDGVPDRQPTASRFVDTPRRQVAEMHQRICGSGESARNAVAPSTPRAPRAPSTPSAPSATPPNPATTPSTPSRGATAATSSEVQPFIGQRLVVSDPSTWPPSDVEQLPPFAVVTTLLEAPTSIQAMNEEYRRGRNGGAALKDLEQRYGPQKRTGCGKSPRHSWRSAHARGAGKSRGFNLAFEKRKPVYDWLDRKIAEGMAEEDAVNELQRRIDEFSVPGKRTMWSKLEEFRKVLIKELRPESYEKNSKRAAEARARTKEKRQRVSPETTSPTT